MKTNSTLSPKIFIWVWLETFIALYFLIARMNFIVLGQKVKSCFSSLNVREGRWTTITFLHFSCIAKQWNPLEGWKWKYFWKKESLQNVPFQFGGGENEEKQTVLVLSTSSEIDIEANSPCCPKYRCWLPYMINLFIRFSAFLFHIWKYICRYLLFFCFFFPRR